MDKKKDSPVLNLGKEIERWKKEHKAVQYMIMDASQDQEGYEDPDLIPGLAHSFGYSVISTLNYLAGDYSPGEGVLAVFADEDIALTVERRTNDIYDKKLVSLEKTKNGAKVNGEDARSDRMSNGINR